MRKTGGFTLIELMVVIAIAAILTSLAAPSFTRLIQSTSLSSDVNTFLADMRFARNEAVRRGTLIVMCSSQNPEATTPTCATSGASEWNTGWIIFEDRNNNSIHAADEPLLKQQGPLPSTFSITSSSTAKFRFVATGRSRGLGSAEMMTFNANSSNDNATKRVVCINMSGRARIAGDGSATCAANQ
jgi:type IV fimbrial biogenesis protein FimT